MNILDLGTGRNWQHYDDEQYSGDTVRCVDQSYLHNNHNILPNVTIYNMDIQTYLEQTDTPDVDLVTAHRIFEHIKPTEIQYLLYLIGTVTKPGGQLEIIVPDLSKVAEQLNALDPHIQTAYEFNRGMIAIHTEVFNEIADPHQSIWTKKLAEYYLTLEHIWSDLQLSYTTIDNRDWYLKIIATKV